MRVKPISVEDLVEDAAMAVNNEDSTVPAVQVQVANYKEELAALKKANGDGTDPAADTSGTSDTDPANAAGGTEDDNAGEDPVVEEEPNDLPATEPSVENLHYAYEGINVARSLGRIVRVLESAHAHGGATAQAGRVAYECASALAGSVGFRLSTKNYSAEGFESFSTRLKHTEIAIESISDVAKDIWNAIKQFFRSIWNWMKEYLFGIKQQVRAQEDVYKEINEQFQELQAKLKDKDAEVLELKMKKVREKSYRARAQNLISAPKGTWEDIVLGGEQYTRFIENYGGNLYSLLQTKFVPVIQQLMRADPDIDACKVRFSESDFGGMQLTVSRDSVGKGAAKTGMVTLVSEVLPGNKQLLVVAPRNADQKAMDELSGSTQVDWIDHNQGKGRGISEVEAEIDPDAMEKVMDVLKRTDKAIGKLATVLTDNYTRVKQKTESFLAADMRPWVNLDDDQIKELQAITNEMLRLQTSVVERAVVQVLRSAQAFTGATGEYLTFCMNQANKIAEVSQAATAQA